MKKKKLFMKFFIATLLMGGIISPFKAKAQTWTGTCNTASYNFSYTTGSAVAAGDNYFLYNIGAGCFLTGGMDWGSHASADHAGKVITLTAKTNGYSIYTAYYSANGVENNGYLATNGYTDGSDDANWVFTPVTVNGYTNAYTIKTGNDYLYYDASDTRVQIGSSTGNNYSYWLLIPRSARNDVGDYTYYLQMSALIVRGNVRFGVDMIGTKTIGAIGKIRQTMAGPIIRITRWVVTMKIHVVRSITIYSIFIRPFRRVFQKVVIVFMLRLSGGTVLQEKHIFI